MNTLAAFALCGSVLMGAFTMVRADQPGPDWMPMEQVIAKVLQSGYSLISKLEADDGRWDGEGIKNGKKMDFHADPKTGVIIAEKPAD
jgi:hypothetical protein